jgi:hypothetical protein
LWKPYIILKTMLDYAAPGDLILYSDSDSHFTSSALAFLEQADKLGILIMTTGHLEKKFTKIDTAIIMNATGTVLLAFLSYPFLQIY